MINSNKTMKYQLRNALKIDLKAIIKQIMLVKQIKFYSIEHQFIVNKLLYNTPIILQVNIIYLWNHCTLTNTNTKKQKHTTKKKK